MKTINLDQKIMFCKQCGKPFDFINRNGQYKQYCGRDCQSTYASKNLRHNDPKAGKKRAVLNIADEIKRMEKEYISKFCGDKKC